MKHTTGALELIGGPMFSGKCLGENTPILMYDGNIKMVQDIVQGDVIMGDDSLPRNIISVCSGESELFQVVPEFGDPYIINEYHILSLKCSYAPPKYENTVNPKYKKGKIINISVKDYLKESNTFRSYYKGYKVGIEFKYEPVPLDPYILGLWLGDGTSLEPEFTTVDREILDAVRLYADEIGLIVKNKSDITYRITNGTLGHKNPFIDVLRLLNVHGNKHIPLLYKANSRQIRLALLAGLLDTDGYYDVKGHSYQIVQKSKILADDILFLARSLGFVAYQRGIEKYCIYKGEKRYGSYYNVHISGSLMHEIPCRLERKKAIPHINRNELLVGISVKSIGFGKYFGFEIDGNHLFLLGDFTVTHNTTELLRRLSCDLSIGRKILYINHSLDTRSKEPYSTHNPLYKEKLDTLSGIRMINCSSLPPLETIVEFNTIGIDEAQFFEELREVQNYVEKGKKRVIISGLISDAKREKFGHIIDLIHIADTYTQLCASCVICVNETSDVIPAIFTHRIAGTPRGQIDLGGSDKYIPVCRKHYIQFNTPLEE